MSIWFVWRGNLNLNLELVVDLISYLLLKIALALSLGNKCGTNWSHLNISVLIAFLLNCFINTYIYWSRSNCLLNTSRWIEGVCRDIVQEYFRWVNLFYFCPWLHLKEVIINGILMQRLLQIRVLIMQYCLWRLHFLLRSLVCHWEGRSVRLVSWNMMIVLMKIILLSMPSCCSANQRTLTSPIIILWRLSQGLVKYCIRFVKDLVLYFSYSFIN